MMEQIAVDKAAADEKRAVALIDERNATAKADECKKIKGQAQAVLDQALPALDAAVKILRNLKVKDILIVKLLFVNCFKIQLVIIGHTGQVVYQLTACDTAISSTGSTSSPRVVRLFRRCSPAYELPGQARQVRSPQVCSEQA